ncbi:MAG: extracellular solute-binding protein [Lachnospiraceae bacterium]|nr:extracellular solute-binding protein [Lachnospiraceae bacterium]
MKKKKLNKYTAIVWLIMLVFVTGVIWNLADGNVHSVERGNYSDESELSSLAEYSQLYEIYNANRDSYSSLCTEYQTSGYQGVDVSILLLPEDADTMRKGILQEDVAEYEGRALFLDENVSATWTFQIEEAGLYSIEVEYIGVEGNGTKIQRQLLIDGELPCREAANVCFYRRFVEDGDVGVNEIGDEVWPRQKEEVCWQTRKISDSKGYDPQPMYFYFAEGEHTITLNYVDQPITIGKLVLEGKKEIPTYARKKEEYIVNGYRQATAGSGCYLEAENSAWRNDSIIRREHNSDPKTVPFSITNRKLNTLGGGRWNRGEQSVSWEFDVEEDGLYQIAIKVLQNKDAGMPAYRKIEIDGEVPFREFLEYEFPYADDWYGEVLSDREGEPYLVYLEKGTHEITLSAQLGPLSAVIERTTCDITVLSEITRKIVQITGTDPDPNYEYELYRTMPELSEQLEELALSVEQCAYILEQVTNKKTSTENNYRQIVDTLAGFAEDVDRIPKALGELESAQSSLGTYITGLEKSPLSIDYFEIQSPYEVFNVENSRFYERFYASMVNFMLSFVKDYDSIGGKTEEGLEENTVIDVWIGRGAEWGEILKDMIDEQFTPETGIYVNLNVLPSGQLSTGGVNALLLSITSGTVPDVALSVDYSLPSELAFRGSAVDLTQFEDYEETAAQFYEESLVPYRFGDGVYALPETMDFTVMFYRKDIISELGIELPQTWDQLYQEVLPKLYENSMSFALPVDTSVSSSTPAALRGYTMLLMQHGGSYYTADGKKSALDSAEAYQAFKMWTEMYSQYDIDEESNFFSRMRSGAMPIGIGGYSNYIQFLTSAPELYGRWGIAPVPGIEDKNGMITRSTGTLSQTANIIFSQSDRQDAAWEFLKWWMDEETQSDYGRQLEALIGQSARWNTANIKAFYSLPWNTEDKAVIQSQLENAKEQYIVPGGYFTSRHIINAWNRVVINNENTRDSMEEAVADINKEIAVKIEEFGLEDMEIIGQESDR